MKSQSPIVGNDQVVEILQELVDSDRLSPAVAFLGPNGVGKSTAAIWLAQRNMCEHQGGPCGTCSTCRRVKNGTSERLWVIAGDDESSISIDQVRDAIERFSYVLDGQAWLIISRADRMTEAAQNALLKFLEEPPRQLRIILTAPHASVLAPTVRSRVSLYHWQRVPLAELRAAWPNASMADVRAADGRPGVLQVLIADTERDQWHAQAVAVLEASIHQQPLPTLTTDSPEVLYRAEEGILREALLRDVGLTESTTRHALTGASRAHLVWLLQRLLNRFASRQQHISSQTLYAHLHLA